MALTPLPEPELLENEADISIGRNSFVGVGGKGIELKLEPGFKPKIYSPLLLSENELELTVNVPNSAYKPVEPPSSLLLLYLKVLPEK